MSSGGYKADDQAGVYFITCTVHQWADVFTRKLYVEILLNSIRYCQQNKGREVNAWVVMSNHIHFNPVRAVIGEKVEEYLLSSCGDFYSTRKGLLELAVF